MKVYDDEELIKLTLTGRFIEHTINTVPDNFKNSDIRFCCKVF